MELRRLREQAGVTIDHVAARLECSASKISRIETGQTGVVPRDVRNILEIYGLDQVMIDNLVEIAEQAREKGWWQLYGDVLTSAYVGLEAAADRAYSYEAQVVPGLLQTEDYARAMLQAARLDIADDEIDRRVRVRQSRQSLLTQDEPIDFWVVLDEAVLRRPVGGPAVMWRQFNHLIAMARRPNVTVQVLPFAAGAHAGMDGTFSMLLYEESASQNFVFAANAAGGVLLDKYDELQRYAFIFDHLRSLALAPDDSIAMIATLAEQEQTMCADNDVPLDCPMGISMPVGAPSISEASSPSSASRGLAEVGDARWHKSTRSGPFSDNCVEVSIMKAAVKVRDSKDPIGGILEFSPDRWQVFVRDARLGRFDLP
jgi:transcriptional regulator with XRE-family HTH domain